MGVSCAMFGQLFGVSQTTIHFWEDGKYNRNPPLAYAVVMIKLREKINSINDKTTIKNTVKDICVSGGILGFMKWIFN